jgi:hypothetical protein
MFSTLNRLLSEITPLFNASLQFIGFSTCTGKNPQIYRISPRTLSATIMIPAYVFRKRRGRTECASYNSTKADVSIQFEHSILAAGVL